MKNIKDPILKCPHQKKLDKDFWVHFIMGRKVDGK